MGKHPDVLVVGGGIIGLTTAYLLARAGVAVEVIDRADLGREASWAGAGILPPGNPDRAATPADQLRGIGSRDFPAFAAELHALTGIDPGYRRTGGVEFLGPDDADIPGLWDAEGIAFERLTAEQLRWHEPGIGGVSGIPYRLPHCAQVRNPWHLRALVAACAAVGVRLTPHHPLDALPTAGRCLVAAGAWSGRLLAPYGVELPVRPVRGQIVLFRPTSPVLRHVLMVGKEYLVPRADGRVLAGSTEEPEAGFEKANTAAGIDRLTAFARRLVPALADAEVEQTWAGLRPGSADGLPYLGPVPGVENLFVAAGHGRAGVQLSLGSARVMTALMLGDDPPVDVRPFAVGRVPQLPGATAFRS